jgi:hypothetical protein
MEGMLGRHQLAIAATAILSMPLAGVPSSVEGRQTNPVAATPSSTLAHREDIKFQLTIFGGEHRSVLPVEVINDIMVFKAVVAGKEVWATIDNGMALSLIDDAFVREQGMTLGAEVAPFATAAGPLTQRRVQGVHVIIPGQIDFTAPFSAADLKFLSRAVQRPISIVIGKEYFENLAFLYSRSRRQLEIETSGRLIDGLAQGAAVLATSGDPPKIPVTINGKIVFLTIDLGFNGDVSLSPAAWKSVIGDRAKTYTKPFGNFHALGGEATFTHVPSVKIGNLAIDTVEISERPTLAINGDGLVGMRLLDRFDFLLDEKAEKVILDPSH